MQILGRVWRRQDFEIIDAFCSCTIIPLELSRELVLCIHVYQQQRYLQLETASDRRTDEIHVMIGLHTKYYVYPKGPRKHRKSVNQYITAV